LYVLRNTLGLHGCKFGCGLGQCGACTVLIDGKAARACLTPVKQAAGRSITTEASAAVQARMRSLGIKDEKALQSWFIERMGQYLAQHGRRLIGWDEILEGGVPPSASVMSWRGTQGAIDAARLGHDVVLSPAPTLYFDNLQSHGDDEPSGRLGVQTLATVYKFEAVSPELTAEQAKHVLGAQANIWTEYLTAPWQSHKLAITRLNPEQARWVRIILGFGFLVLGWMKVYNHDLTAGVADNYPGVMNDPLVNMFAMGTDPGLRRETWVVSFGMAEVLSGFMLMTGIFTRFWACMMLWVFTKLMLIDFGWDEIPHIYPIGALLAVLTSNDLRTEFDIVQKTERAMRGNGGLRRLALVAVSSVVIAVVAVLPILWGLTFSNRAMLKP